MSNTIIYNTNLSPQQFNLYYSFHVILYTISNLTIGFLAYDLIFSRFNLDRDNIILLSIICTAGLITLFYFVYIYLLKLKIIESFQITDKKITIVEDDNIEELKKNVSSILERINKLEIDPTNLKKNTNKNEHEKIISESKEEITSESDYLDEV